MVNKKEILIVSPELTIDEKSEEPVFKRDADRTSSSDQLPMPDQIESLFEQEWSTELPGFDLIPSAAPVSFEIPDRLEPWVVEPEMPEPVAFVERPQIESTVPGGQPALALVPAGQPVRSLMPAAGYSQEKHIIFSLAGTKYTAPMSQVMEVGELTTFTRVPGVPDWVLGVTNLHGDIVSIVDIRALLGIDRQDCPEACNLLVIQTFEGDITASLIVEQVLGIANISAAQIQVVETVVGDGLTPYVRGVYTRGDELLNVLNLEGLLRSLDVVH